MTPRGLADAVDVCYESIGFRRAQVEAVLRAAQRFNLPVTLHTGQFAASGGGELAAAYEALSADHLEVCSDADIAAMRATGVGTFRRRLLKDGVMDYRRLGNSGLQVSVIGLGTNNFGVRNDYPEAERLLMQAIEEGINFIETSNTYGEGAAEEFIGKALKGHRDQVLLATKVASNMGDGPNQHGASRKHILTQVEASLRRLQTDYLDLYQIHYYDPFTPLDESLRTLHNLVTQGKVRYIGCSNFAAWQVAEAMGVVRALDLEPLISVEPEYSMLKRGIEKELLPCCQRFNIGILPYFPLASGFLTGKYKRGQAAPAGTRLAVQTQRAEFILTGENFDVLERLEAFASARSRTMVELAFAWLLTHPQVSSVIAGATRPEQIIANAKASEWRLTSEEMNALNDVLQTLAPAWDTPTAHLRPYRPW
jgi:aryl-alcohol dehydrogenase-like predicted oxidoreductase